MKLASFCQVFKAGAFSPQAFIVRAALLATAYCISRLAGLQEYTTFLSGAHPNPQMSWQAGATLGMIHVLLYFGFILLAPIFLITACLLASWRRWRSGKADQVWGQINKSHKSVGETPTDAGETPALPGPKEIS